MRIAVIDGQGGGIGRVVIEKLRLAFKDSVEIYALGTNALATAAMLKAGANEGATGENAILYNLSSVDIIVGSLSIIVANSMLGELTPDIAAGIACSKAKKMLLPIYRGNLQVIGLKPEPLPHLVDQMIDEIKSFGGTENV